MAGLFENQAQILQQPKKLHAHGMTITIHTEPETGIAIASCTRAPQIEDALTGLKRKLRETPDLAGEAVLCEIRNAEFDMSSADPREIAIYLHQHQPKTPPKRVAFISGPEVDYGMVRMFEVYCEDPWTSFQVYRGYDEALTRVNNENRND